MFLSTLRPTRITPGWLWFTPLVAGLVALAFLPPVLEGGARMGLMHGFSLVCHQIPERSLAIGGVPIALCHRCTGILVGLAVGLAVAPLLIRSASAAGRRLLGGVPGRHRAAVLLLLALIPASVDWALGATGLWANTPTSRVLTGAIIGLVAGLLVGRAFLRPPVRSLSLPHT